MGIDLFDLSGKTALITGSSRGIGFALAEAIAAAGGRIILNGRDPRALEAARRRIDGALCYHFDVTDEEAVTDAIDQIEREIGSIDILVNNAGMQYRAPLTEFPVEAFRNVVRTNLEAVFIVGRTVARQMISRGRGKIINIASVTTQAARKDVGAYAASKGAIRTLTQAMCAEWAPYGLQINAIGPGYFATELTKALADDVKFDGWLKARTPAGRWGQLDDLKGTCIFLASDASNFVNGQVIFVDGGMLATL
jgi:gluconate 5-dehydrogenase